MDEYLLVSRCRRKAAWNRRLSSLESLRWGDFLVAGGLLGLLFGRLFKLIALPQYPKKPWTQPAPSFLGLLWFQQ